MCKLFSSQRKNRGVRSLSPASRAASILALMVFVVSTASANVSHAETPFERTLNTALETLSSGVSATAMLGDTQVIVTPLRTWKSISGHYCRRFQVTSTKPASAKVISESTRCRDSGKWKQVIDG